MEHGDEDTATVKSRAVKVTATAMEEQMQRAISSQKAKLTGKMNQIRHISEQEMNKDQANWFESKADAFMDFAERAKTWMDEAHLRIVEATK